MANEQNLRSIGNLTTKEQREICSKGGKASGKKRAEIKSWKEQLSIMMSIPIQTESGEQTTQEALLVSLIKKAMSGDVNALQMIRDTLGQKPVENLNVEIEQNEGIEEMQKALIELARNGSNTNN